MRELNLNELSIVAGGLQGTKVPFSNSFIPGESMNGRPAGAIGAAMAGWSIGVAIGGLVNQFNERVSGMSLGVAIYRTFNGGSRIVTGSGNGTLSSIFTSDSET